MSCPHSRHGDPLRCSSCLGAPARRVTFVDGKAHVEGEEPRPIDAETARTRDDRHWGFGPRRTK